MKKLRRKPPPPPPPPPKGYWTSGWTPWGCPCSIYIVDGEIVEARVFACSIDPSICVKSPESKEASP